VRCGLQIRRSQHRRLSCDLHARRRHRQQAQGPRSGNRRRRPLNERITNASLCESRSGPSRTAASRSWPTTERSAGLRTARFAIREPTSPLRRPKCR
jgi:hypothetical protein